MTTIRDLINEFQNASPQDINERFSSTTYTADIIRLLLESLDRDPVKRSLLLRESVLPLRYPDDVVRYYLTYGDGEPLKEIFRRQDVVDSLEDTSLLRQYRDDFFSDYLEVVRDLINDIGYPSEFFISHPFYQEGMLFHLFSEVEDVDRPLNKEELLDEFLPNLEEFNLSHLLVEFQGNVDDENDLFYVQHFTLNDADQDVDEIMRSLLGNNPDLYYHILSNLDRESLESLDYIDHILTERNFDLLRKALRLPLTEGQFDTIFTQIIHFLQENYIIADQLYDILTILLNDRRFYRNEFYRLLEDLRLEKDDDPRFAELSPYWKSRKIAENIYLRRRISRNEQLTDWMTYCSSYLDHGKEKVIMNAKDLLPTLSETRKTLSQYDDATLLYLYTPENWLSRNHLIEEIIRHYHPEFYPDFAKTEEYLDYLLGEMQQRLPFEIMNAVVFHYNKLARQLFSISPPFYQDKALRAALLHNKELALFFLNDINRELSDDLLDLVITLNDPDIFSIVIQDYLYGSQQVSISEMVREKGANRLLPLLPH